jgi:phosphosulfolactate synthase (CoM biosynthesis protein A)
MAMEKRMMEFLDLMEREEEKPRRLGLTGVQEAGLEATGPFIDYIKFRTYTFRLYPEKLIKAKIDICHDNDIKVMMGGNVSELAWFQGIWEKLVEETKAFGWDTIELSATYAPLDEAELIRMAEHSAKAGLEVVYEWGVKKPKGPLDPDQASDRIKALLDHGVKLVILEQGEIDMLLGVGELSPNARLMDQLFEKVGLENIMIEAVRQEHLIWLLKNYGAVVNIGPNLQFEQVMHLEPMRRGIGRGVDYFHYDKYLDALNQKHPPQE